MHLCRVALPQCQHGRTRPLTLSLARLGPYSLVCTLHDTNEQLHEVGRERRLAVIRGVIANVACEVVERLHAVDSRRGVAYATLGLNRVNSRRRRL